MICVGYLLVEDALVEWLMGQAQMAFYMSDFSVAASALKIESL